LLTAPRPIPPPGAMRRLPAPAAPRGSVASDMRAATLTRRGRRSPQRHAQRELRRDPGQLVRVAKRKQIAALHIEDDIGRVQEMGAEQALDERTTTDAVLVHAAHRDPEERDQPAPAGV